MRLPKRRRSEKPEESVTETLVGEEITIDISTPRECIHKSFKGHPGSCPRCGSLLQQCSQVYMVMTRRGGRPADSFIANDDTGGFCPQCPTVVINPAVFGERLQYSLPHWDMGSAFAVVGILDLDAIPEEKRHLPLGGDDNPYPLVEFTNLSEIKDSRRSKRKSSRRKRKPPARKKRKKRRR